MIMFVSVLSWWITRQIHDPNSIAMSPGSVITIISCGVDRGSVVTGSYTAALLADAATLLWKRRLQSVMVPISAAVLLVR